jgi:hypothetical protein
LLFLLTAATVNAQQITGELPGAAIEDPANAYKWELYDVTRDWTQNDDVAAANR